MSQGFKDLKVWQKAMKLAVTVYELTKPFPKEELYGLTSQLRGSAISIPSNIAEGQGRLNPGEFKQFLGVARGSNFELQTQLELAQALKYGDSVRIDSAMKDSHEVGRMLYALVESLSSN